MAPEVLRYKLVRESVSRVGPFDRLAPDKPIHLTEREYDFYSFITDTFEQTGISPTVREMQDTFDISSTSVVKYHLNKLYDKGCIMQEGLTKGKKKGRRFVPIMPMNMIFVDEDEG